MLLELCERVSPRVIEAPSYFDAVRRELDEYFEGRRTRFGLPLDWSLTGGFGRRVLKHTARIPYGKVSTYKEMAAAAGSPRGARAAGNALGSNPIPIVVPCHRVLHSGGGLGGYGGGLDNKEFLLKLEGAIGERRRAPRLYSVTVWAFTAPARSASSAPRAIARSWIARPVESNRVMSRRRAAAGREARAHGARAP